MRSDKILGYITGSELPFGVRVSQRIQNSLIREYCESRGYVYLLSDTEYLASSDWLVLRSIPNNGGSWDGLCLYSIFQLPDDLELRIGIVKRFFEREQKLHFALEGVCAANLREFAYVNHIWEIRKSSITWLPNGLRR